MAKDESTNDTSERRGPLQRGPRRRGPTERTNRDREIQEPESSDENTPSPSAPEEAQPDSAAPMRRPIRGRRPQDRADAAEPAEAPETDTIPPRRRSAEQRLLRDPASRRRPDGAATPLSRRRALRDNDEQESEAMDRPAPRRERQRRVEPDETAPTPSRVRRHSLRDSAAEPEPSAPPTGAARRRSRIHRDASEQLEPEPAAQQRPREKSPEDSPLTARRTARTRAASAVEEELPAKRTPSRKETSDEPSSHNRRSSARPTGARSPAPPRETEKKQPPKAAPVQEPPVKKGQICPVTINSVGSRGEGIGHCGSFTVFVPYALPGEKVMAYIDQVKKSYAKGRLKDIPNRSEDRVPPACPIYTRCGGCQLQHMSYNAQLKIKQQQVIDAVTRIAKRPTLPIKETIGSPKPWNYRNKMQFPIGFKEGKIRIGCFARGTHEIIDTENCLIQDAANNAALNAVRQIVTELGIPTYDEVQRTGILRHVISRVDKSNCLMVTLVTATRQLPREKEFVRLLRERLPQVVSIQQNIQSEHNNVIMGRDTKLLWGSPTIRIILNRQEFHISPHSFFQVNTQQAETLYNKALGYAGLTGREIVVDAYCGIGTITLLCAQRARKAIGIEIIPSAVLDAQKNARDSQIKNAEFIAGDATLVMPRLHSQGVRPDIVFVDPPRAGCTPEFLKTCSEMQPTKIIYISCNPASMARDIAILDKLGYHAKEVQPVDMFPQTSHVETVTLIVRKDGAS